MQFAQAIVLFATLSASAVSATPAQSGSKRQSDLAIVNMWSGDNCDGNQDTVHIQGSGAYRCVPVSGKRSIAAPEKRDCTIKTFSGSDCRGSHWTVPDGDTGCHSVLYGSVEISC